MDLQIKSKCGVGQAVLRSSECFDSRDSFRWQCLCEAATAAAFDRGLSACILISAISYPSSDSVIRTPFCAANNQCSLQEHLQDWAIILKLQQIACKYNDSGQK